MLPKVHFSPQEIGNIGVSGKMMIFMLDNKKRKYCQ